MDVKIYPCKLDGVIEAISYKSMAHRLFIAAALADNKTEIYLKNNADDVESTAECLTSLGARFSVKENVYTVSPVWENLPESTSLNVGTSGVTLRFLLPIVTALGVSAAFVGDVKSAEKQFEYLDLIKGCGFSDFKLPFSVKGELKGGEYRLKGDMSSQFINGLMLALPIIKEDSKIIFTTPLISKSFADMTVRIMSVFGVKIQEDSDGYTIKGNQKYISPLKAEVEGDYANAAAFMCGNIIGNRVRITGLNANSTQNDKKIKDLLMAFNAKGTVLDVKGLPDLVPALAVAACYASSRTEIINASRVKIAGGDRLSALALNLNKIGASITETPNGLIIEGTGGLKGGAITDSFGDHRIAMAIAIAATMAKEPVTVLCAEAVKKTYPTFFNDFVFLGGKCDVL